MPSGRAMFENGPTGLTTIETPQGPSLADMMHLGLQRQRMQQAEEQNQRNYELQQQKLVMDQQQAQHQLFKDMYNFSQNPQIAANPDVQDALFGTMGKMLGLPELSAESMRLSRGSMKNLYKAAVTGSPEQSADALAEVATRLSPEDFSKVSDAFSKFDISRERMEAVRVHRQIEEAKYNQLQDQTVKVEVGRKYYTPAAMVFRDALRGTETKEYQDVMGGVERILKNSSGQKGSSQAIQDLLIKSKFPQFSKEQSDQLAETYAQKRQEFAAMADISTKVLDDVNKGVTGLSFAGKAALNHRINVGLELSDAYSALEAFARDPFNLDKLKEAKQAGQTIEAQRQAMDKLQAKNDQTAVQLRQDALSFRQSEAGQKHAYETAVADAQQQFASLDTTKQTPQMAAQVAKQYKDATGISVKVDDIMKGIADPNKPLVQNKLEVKTGEALAKGVEDIVKETRSGALGALDTIDSANRIHDAIQSNNVNLGPTATVRTVMGRIGQIIGVGGDTESERIVNTRNVIRGLAEFSLAARKQLKGQGQVSDFEGKLLAKAASGEIEDFTKNELQSFIGVTDRLARKQYALHEQSIGTMRNNPNLKELVPFYEVPPLPPSKIASKGVPSKQSGPSLKTLPQGSKQIGTSNGKPVYQSPDGKKWIGD